MTTYIIRTSKSLHQMLAALIHDIERKKAQLDRLRPMSGAALAQLQKHYDVDLTYTSNAIEGNTLTLRETAELIEHGITVGGKPLRDHLEAVDHYDAVQWVRAVAAASTPLDEATICELHRRIVLRSQPEIAGIYSRLPRRIAGSPVVFPNPVKIPQLMAELDTWLKAAPSDPRAAFEAHFRLTAIHPFADGNGRTARGCCSVAAIHRLRCVRRIARRISTRWSAARLPRIWSPFRPSCTSGWTRPWGNS
jgi:Fic family protein